MSGCSVRWRATASPSICWSPSWRFSTPPSKLRRSPLNGAEPILVAERIVSLLPSATEIVAALGCAGRLVGRSHECDFPPEVVRLPALTASKLDGEGTSYAIDQRLKSIVQEGLAVYRVDGEKLRALAPDVIVTQDQCEVCAVSLKDVEAAVCAWTDRAARIVSLSPASLADVWADMRRVAEALGVAGRGAALVQRLETRVAAIAARAAAAPDRPRIACIEWIEPLMAAGNWMPEMVGLAGGVNLFGEAGRHSPWLDWDALRAGDPDVILIAPCGFDVARSRRDLPALEALPGWGALPAVRARRVYIADGNQYFNRPGPRLVESLEILAEILHPTQCRHGHEGTGWVRP
jgi:iron complex transport system substrate-binding protein